MANDYDGMKSKDENDLVQGCLSPNMWLWCGLAIWDFSLILTKNNQRTYSILSSSKDENASFITIMIPCTDTVQIFAKGPFATISCYYLNSTSPSTMLQFRSSFTKQISMEVYGPRTNWLCECLWSAAPSSEWPNFVLRSHSFSLN